MRRFVSLAFLASLAGSPNAADEVLSAVVFTDREHPIMHVDSLPGAKIYRVDVLPSALARLSEGLPADDHAATGIVSRRLSILDAEALRSCAQGLVLAKLRYRLDRYPAVVFEGRAVIYGVTDLAVARRIYLEYVQGRIEE